jgi:hypothetical protein
VLESLPYQRYHGSMAMSNSSQGIGTRGSLSVAFQVGVPWNGNWYSHALVTSDFREVSSFPVGRHFLVFRSLVAGR